MNCGILGGRDFRTNFGSGRDPSRNPDKFLRFGCFAERHLLTFTGVLIQTTSETLMIKPANHISTSQSRARSQKYFQFNLLCFLRAPSGNAFWCQFTHLHVTLLSISVGFRHGDLGWIFITIIMQ
ncbi:hypothetical protein SCHPADRAFT_346545 [Schizopora paradoxa]|uniref:Uncharacterized protein n=1 Tax=Schizopora paradoxa TaxID=27342 RepID=A0A0H2RQ78_9AGAM|nr:hypothetical protein SCHPADRAFT_346545 [Schizopora paradoxa]